MNLSTMSSTVRSYVVGWIAQLQAPYGCIPCVGSERDTAILTGRPQRRVTLKQNILRQRNADAVSIDLLVGQSLDGDVQPGRSRFSREVGVCLQNTNPSLAQLQFGIRLNDIGTQPRIFDVVGHRCEDINAFDSLEGSPANVWVILC